MLPLIIVSGKIRSGDYHRAVKHCESLVAQHPGRFRFRALPGMTDTAYETHSEVRRRELGISALRFKGACLVYTDEGQLIGGADDLARWAARRLPGPAPQDGTPAVLYDALARTAYRTWREGTGHRFREVSFSVDGVGVGSCVIELFVDLCPSTCANFEALCNAGAYTRTPVHRVVRGGWVQMGDTEGGSGDGGTAADGGEFPDECFAVSHDTQGIVGMANHGRHTNGSQFYITTRPMPHFDKRFVAFGRVIEGMRAVRIVEREETLNDRPIRSVLVSGTEPASFGIADAAESAKADAAKSSAAEGQAAEA
jgi:cyclophilin family peptidyl-prolyl cis-trans isomerase